MILLAILLIASNVIYAEDPNAENGPGDQSNYGAGRYICKFKLSSWCKDLSYLKSKRKRNKRSR